MWIIITHFSQICCRCDCPPEFTGMNCESPYIPCSPSPCQSGGSCIVMGQLSYACNCVQGKPNKFTYCDTRRVYTYLICGSQVELFNDCISLTDTIFSSEENVQYLIEVSSANFFNNYNRFWDCLVTGVLLTKVWSISRLNIQPGRTGEKLSSAYDDW